MKITNLIICYCTHVWVISYNKFLKLLWITNKLLILNSFHLITVLGSSSMWNITKLTVKLYTISLGSRKCIEW